jgi:putative tricarboxylic transport membrane protein
MDFPKGNRMSGLIWVVIGIAVCIGAIQLGLGHLHNPGTGLSPFMSGSLLVFLGIILLFTGVSKKSGKEDHVYERKGIVVKGNQKILFLTLLVLVGYILLFEFLGFSLSTFFFFFSLCKLTRPKRWLMPLLFSGSSVILSYLIFSVWLKAQLPAGIVGF